MDLKILQDVAEAVLLAPSEAEAQAVLNFQLKKKNIEYPAFIRALQAALEKNLTPLKFSTDQLIQLLNRINISPLRTPDILKKIPEAKKAQLHSDLDRYPLLAAVLAADGPRIKTADEKADAISEADGASYGNFLKTVQEMGYLMAQVQRFAEQSNPFFTPEETQKLMSAFTLLEKAVIPRPLWIYRDDGHLDYPAMRKKYQR